MNARRIRDSSVERVDRWMRRGWLVELAVDWDAAFEIACDLSQKHTDRTGGRAIDLLHVAFAKSIEAESFLTTDERQGGIARAEGLKVIAPDGE